jgi:hypothetical protein
MGTAFAFGEAAVMFNHGGSGSWTSEQRGPSNKLAEGHAVASHSETVGCAEVAVEVCLLALSLQLL